MLISTHLTPSSLPSSDLPVLKSRLGGAAVVQRTKTSLVGITSEDLLLGHSGPTGTSSKSTIETIWTHFLSGGHWWVLSPVTMSWFLTSKSGAEELAPKPELLVSEEHICSCHKNHFLPDKSSNQHLLPRTKNPFGRKGLAEFSEPVYLLDHCYRRTSSDWPEHQDGPSAMVSSLVCLVTPFNMPTLTCTHTCTQHICAQMTSDLGHLGLLGLFQRSFWSLFILHEDLPHA